MPEQSPTATRRATGVDKPLGFDRLPMARGTWLPLLSVGATLFGGPMIDEGTRVVDRLDYRSVMNGTSLASVHVEGPLIPFMAPTRMARIRSMAPLSLREWAPVFGVSHSAIKQWADGDEPNREKLDRVLGAISEARAHHPDLKGWLTTGLPGMDVRPLDLLRENRWRAFRGAIRARSAPAVDIAPDELVRHRRAQVSWAVPEPLTVADEA